MASVDGDLVALAVAGRPGVGPGRLGTHYQRATPVNPGNGAAPGANRVDVDHGHTDGVASQNRRGGLLDAARAQGHIGGGAAHVQRDDVRVAGLNAGMEGPHYAAGRAAQDGAYRLLRRQSCGDASAGRLHNPQPLAQRLLQFPQVSGHHRPDVGVDHNRAGALVLPELRYYPAGGGNEGRTFQPAQGLHHHLFVQGVDEGEQEGYSHPINVGIPQQGNQRVYGLRRQVLQDSPGVVHPLRQPEPQLPWGQGRGALQVQVVQFRAALASDFQHVLEAQGGNEGGASPLPFQQGIGGDGGPVDEVGVAEPFRRYKLRAGFGDSPSDTPRRVCQSRCQLVDGQLTIPEHCDIGKSAADIDADNCSGHFGGRASRQRCCSAVEGGCFRGMVIQRRSFPHGSLRQGRVGRESLLAFSFPR